MKITSVSLPTELTEKIDQVARDSERSRSFVVRKLLESALTGQERLDALQAIADAGPADYAANATRERGPNATAVIAESCADGRARLDALQKIAAGKKGTR
jgi:Arc/MetJ-type ribon-helix-helix transcriptional regulator